MSEALGLSTLAAPQLPRLSIQGEKPRVLLVDSSSFLIGQATECDLVLMGPGVHEYHCFLFDSPHGWQIRFLNQGIGFSPHDRAKKENELTDGRQFQVGPWNLKWLYFAGDIPDQTPMPAHRFDGVELTEHLRECFRKLDRRTEELEIAERELFLDQDALAEGYNSLQTKVREWETILAERMNRLEQEINQRWEQFQRDRARLLDSQSESISKAGEGSELLDAQELIRRLEVRSKELEAYAAHLIRLERRLKDQELELAWQRVQDAADRQAAERAHQRLAQDQEHTAQALEEERKKLSLQHQAFLMEQRLREQIQHHAGL